MAQRIEHYREYPQDTRWATDEEIMSPNSSTAIHIEDDHYKACGLILKSDGRLSYVDAHNRHSLIIGSTGSGKSRLLCMPMIHIMAGAGESFVVTDPKGELFEKTSSAVKGHGYKVIVLDFRDMNRGDTWNPLKIPYDLYREGKKDEAQSMINDLVSTLTAGHHASDPYWTEMAASLLLANILVMFETARPSEVNMHSLCRMCLEYSRPSADNLIYQISRLMNPDSIAAMNYAGVCIDADKTKSSITSVVQSVLKIFNTQESLLRMMSDSSFDIRMLPREKTAIYLIIPDEKSTFHFLASLFTKQCYEILVSEASRSEDKKLPTRVHFILDEFGNLPVIPDMASMISAARSRNIRFHLVIQGFNQLKNKYGLDAETITGNCVNWIYLNSREYDCLDQISKRCGTYYDQNGQLRSLVSAAKLQHLDKEKGEVLIFQDRHYPYISYLSDISTYEFPEEESMPEDLGITRRRNSDIFDLDRIVAEISEGKREKLFYQKADQAGQLVQITKAEQYGQGLQNSHAGQDGQGLQTAHTGQTGTGSPKSQILHGVLGDHSDTSKEHQLFAADPSARHRLQNLHNYHKKLISEHASDTEMLMFLTRTDNSMEKIGLDLGHDNPDYLEEILIRDSEYLYTISQIAAEYDFSASSEFPQICYLQLDHVLSALKIMDQQTGKLDKGLRFAPANLNKEYSAAIGITALAIMLLKQNYYEQASICLNIPMDQLMLRQTYHHFNHLLTDIDLILSQIEKEENQETRLQRIDEFERTLSSNYLDTGSLSQKASEGSSFISRLLAGPAGSDSDEESLTNAFHYLEEAIRWYCAE